MDDMLAYAMGLANRGKEQMVFDWDKAARIIKERNIDCAAAGLKDDFEWTGGCIFKDGNSLPAATVHELNKLKEYLHKNNYSVETKYYDDINGFWCMRSIDCQDYDLSWNIQPDIILVLSCPSGQHALSEELSGYTVIGITETLGGLSYCYRDVAGDRFIIKEKSRVLPIQ